MQEWQGFATRQAQRYVPAPHDPNRRTLQDSACYRLRVLHVDNLPPPQLSSGVQFRLQLGVTLFDEAAGQHYGSTCYSLVEPLLGQQQPGVEEEAAAGSEPSLDFSFDVFFHTTIADAHCMAVVSKQLVSLTSLSMPMRIACLSTCVNTGFDCCLQPAQCIPAARTTKAFLGSMASTRRSTDVTGHGATCRLS